MQTLRSFFSTALLGRGYLTSREIPQLIKHTIQIDEKNNFIDTNLLANMDILNLRGSGFRTVGVSTCPQFDPRETPIPWTTGIWYFGPPFLVIHKKHKNISLSGLR